MAFANSVILYNCKLNHNGLFACDFGGSGATRDSVMGDTNSLATYKFGYSSCTYMRKDKVIVVDENADVLDAAGINYCRYINGDFSNPMFSYVFVDSLEYVAPRTSRLHIRTDCFMTYFDRIQPNECFVEREHVHEDIVGQHLMPEPTPNFEMICINDWERVWNSATPGWFMNYFYVGAYATHAPGSDPIAPVIPVNYVGNVPSPGHLYITQVDDGAAMFGELVNQKYEISYTVIVPKSAIDAIATNRSGIFVAQDKTEEDNWSGDEEINIGGPFVTDILYLSGHYEVNNHKLCSYPYQYIEMTDMWDQSVVLKPESIAPYGGDAVFYLHPESGAIPSFTLYCKNYENESAFRNSISINCFPAVPYVTSYYAQYMAIHKNQVEVERLKHDKEMIKGFVGAGADVTSGITQLGAGSSTGASSIGKGVSGIMDTEIARRDYNAKYDDMKQRPPIVCNAPDGSTKLGIDGIGFHINRWFPKTAFIQELDSFFDRYGYNVSMCKTPQWNSRPKFNYIKTVGSNISGKIPESDKEVINSLLNAGLTVWHSIGDYGIYYGRNNLAPVR